MPYVLRSSTRNIENVPGVIQSVRLTSPKVSVPSWASPGALVPDLIVTDEGLTPHPFQDSIALVPEEFQDTPCTENLLTQDQNHFVENCNKFNNQIVNITLSPVENVSKDQGAFLEITEESHRRCGSGGNKAFSWTESEVAELCQPHFSHFIQGNHKGDALSASVRDCRLENHRPVTEGRSNLNCFNVSPLLPLFDLSSPDLVYPDEYAQGSNGQLIDFPEEVGDPISVPYAQENGIQDELYSSSNAASLQRQDNFEVSEIVSNSSSLTSCNTSSQSSNDLHCNLHEVSECDQQDLKLSTADQASVEDVGGGLPATLQPTQPQSNDEQDDQEEASQTHFESNKAARARVTILTEGLALDGKKCIRKEVVNAFICDLCSRRHATKESLEAHRRRKHKVTQGEESLRCHHCQLVLANKTNLTRHLKGVHGPDAKHECDFCGVKFGSKKTLAEHKERQHGEIPETYKSRRRRYAAPGSNDSKSRRRASQRKKVVSAGENEYVGGKESEDDDVPLLQKRVFKCGFCELVSQHRGNIKRHENIVHKGLKPFECEVCRKKFGTKDNLKLHKCRKGKRRQED